MDDVQKCSHNRSPNFGEPPLKWPALYISSAKILNSKCLLRWKMRKARLPPTDYGDEAHAIENDYKQ